jgi:hypothetical protein
VAGTTKWVNCDRFGGARRRWRDGAICHKYAPSIVGLRPIVVSHPFSRRSVAVNSVISSASSATRIVFLPVFTFASSHGPVPAHKLKLKLSVALPFIFDVRALRNPVRQVPTKIDLGGKELTVAHDVHLAIAEALPC